MDPIGKLLKVSSSTVRLNCPQTLSTPEHGRRRHLKPQKRWRQLQRRTPLIRYPLTIKTACSLSLSIT